MSLWVSTTGPGRSQVSTWLLGIARHKALSARRRNRELQLDEQIASAIEDPADNPEQILLNRSRASVIARCIGQLSQRQREVIDQMLSCMLCGAHCLLVGGNGAFRCDID